MQSVQLQMYVFIERHSCAINAKVFVVLCMVLQFNSLTLLITDDLDSRLDISKAIKGIYVYRKCTGLHVAVYIDIVWTLDRATSHKF